MSILQIRENEAISPREILSALMCRLVPTGTTKGAITCIKDCYREKPFFFYKMNNRYS